MLLIGCAPSEPVNVIDNQSCLQSEDLLGELITIPEGSFVKGAEPIYPEEAPSVRVHVEAFQIQVHEVTNQQFSEFVRETDYVTDAERGVLNGRDDAGSAVFTHPDSQQEKNQHWALERYANWRHPEGGDSSIDKRPLHPVVHVSKRDAEAYANWAGGRLPSEVEWEYAATLGLPDPNTPASGAYGESGARANTWQGVFPVIDLAEDGYAGIAPVGCFAPDRLGLYDMIGNVWEWTDTPFSESTHTLKGGSYLCANNFCRRYRPAARHPQETDFSSNHIGFRIVQDLPGTESD
ncbi:MAG: formylglycine-generating enzyme family protein [Pseudomonadota bacterium]